jgi:hypothetical protein
MKNIFPKLLPLLLLCVSVAATAQVPVYNSYPVPGAPTIFLDFDGQTVSGTQWNSGVGTIAAGPSNLDSSKITEVYNRIAEDYRPFNINVTTDSAKYFAAPVKQRMRVIFTISHSWYYQAVGGISYIGSFTWGDNTPCWVFTAALNYNVKNISEAGAHEAGHTLGLRHQARYDANCVKLSDYSTGTGTGEIGWAPIMGVGYSKNFTTWTEGQSSVGCTTIQSDISVITKAANGVTYRPDDYAETFSGAAAAPLVDNEFDVSGVIIKSDDKDMFKFTVATAGRFQLTAIPYSVGANNTGSDLDMQVQLYDAAQAQMGSYNPEPLLNSVIDTVLDPGTYYLLVDGKGNQFASEYGSLGSYELQGAFSAFAVLPVHKMELKGVNDNGMHKLSWEIVADERITRQVLETSVNGQDYYAVTELSTAARAYSYFPNAGKTVQYRVSVDFDNGRHYYSNLVALRNKTAQKPELQANIVSSGTLVVTSPSNYSYVITDYSGRELSRGTIAQGSSTIRLTGMASGAYLVRFSNESEQHVEKFIRQ